MNTISRRLRKLEDRLGPSLKRNGHGALRARLEAGRRRVAELRAEPVQLRRRENLIDTRPSLQTIVEILQSGRHRMARFSRIS